MNNIHILMAAVAVAHFNKALERKLTNFYRSKKGRAYVKTMKRAARA